MYKKFIILFVGVLISQSSVMKGCYAAVVGFGGDCSSNTCDKGLYCQDDSFAGETCARCTNIPEHAVNIGTGNNGPTSCPWECQEGYYYNGTDCVHCPYGMVTRDDLPHEEATIAACFWAGDQTFSDSTANTYMASRNWTYLSNTLRALFSNN